MPPSLTPWSQPRVGGAVPSLMIGTMNFGRRTPEAEAKSIVARAIERGAYFFDTANAYVDGEGERILGRAVTGRRDQVLIGSKVGLSRIGGQQAGLLSAGGRSEGLSASRIVAACEESLTRLGTDYLDVYYLHVPDQHTPIEQSLSAVATLLKDGKIRAWATSNYASWQMLEMLLWCQRESVPLPVLTQQMYNLLIRQLDVEYFAFARKYQLHTCAYNPLAGGVLTGARSLEQVPAGSRFHANPMYQRRYWSPRVFAEVDAYRAVAQSCGMPLITLAYAWLKYRPGVDSVIVGPAAVSHLDAALDAQAAVLTPEVLQKLDDIYAEHQGTDARYARL